LPLKDAVRKPQKITVGDEITLEMAVLLQRGVRGPPAT
jgi:hypothetical protein